MSKKKDNIQKKNLNKKTMPTKQEYVDEKMKNLENKLNLIKKHHILLWLILFFPYGLFLLLKHKILPLWVNIIVIIFVSCLIIGVVDAKLYPNRLTDYNTEQNIEDFKEIGNIFSIEQYLQIDNYFIYEVISSKGRFDIYSDVNGNIKSIKQIHPYINNIYNADDFKEEYKDLYSEVIKFLHNNTIDLNPNNIELISSTGYSQNIKLSDVEYCFNISFCEVSEVFDTNNNLLYENTTLSYRINKDLKERVSKKFPQTSNISQVINYEYYDDHYNVFFYTEDGNMFRLIVYKNGKVSVGIQTDKPVVEINTTEE